MKFIRNSLNGSDQQRLKIKRKVIFFGSLSQKLHKIFSLQIFVQSCHANIIVVDIVGINDHLLNLKNGFEEKKAINEPSILFFECGIQKVRKLLKYLFWFPSALSIPHFANKFLQYFRRS